MEDGHLRRLELQPLSQDETATLVAATLGGPVDSVTARRLWAIRPRLHEPDQLGNDQLAIVKRRKLVA